MFRSMSRTAIVAVVALTLVLLSVPAAHARPIERSGPSIEAGSGWIDAALSWLSSLLPGSQPASSDRPSSNVTAADGIPIGGLYRPMVGSCIDPEGRPKPCF
jgi:hypothetical protein